MNPSNYPPGVTGNEWQIVGRPDDNESFDGAAEDWDDWADHCLGDE